MRFTAFLWVLGLTAAAGCNFGIDINSQCDPGYDDIIHNYSSCDGNVLVTMSTSCSKDLGTSRQTCSSSEVCTGSGCMTPCTSDSDCPSGFYCPPLIAGSAPSGDMGFCVVDLQVGTDCSNDLTHCSPGLVCAPSDPSRNVFQAPFGAPTRGNDGGTAGDESGTAAVDAGTVGSDAGTASEAGTGSDAGTAADDASGVAPWVVLALMTCQTLCSADSDPIAPINAAGGACVTPCTTDSDCVAGTVCPPPADAPSLGDGRIYCRMGINLFADCTDEPTHCLPGLVCASPPGGDPGRLACQPDTQTLTPRCNAGAPSVCVGGEQFSCPLSAQTISVNPCDGDQFCVYDANGAPFCASTAVPSPLCQNVLLGTTCDGTWNITCENGYVTDYVDCRAMFESSCAGDGITAPGTCTSP